MFDKLNTPDKEGARREEGGGGDEPRQELCHQTHHHRQHREYLQSGTDYIQIVLRN